MQTWKRLAVVLAVGLAPLASFAEKVAVDGSDNSFESEMTETIGGQSASLMLTGTALREKAWVNVYALGSYIAKDATAKTAEELAAADVPKQLHLVMERDVDGKKMSDALRDGIEANYKVEEFSAEMKSFEEYFQSNPVKTGDHIVFTHVPGVGVTTKVADKEPLEIKNMKFARAVWDIYLGQENISDDIKESLVSRLGK